MDPNQPITPTPVQPVQQPPQSPAPKRMSKGLLVGIIVAAIIILGLAAWFIVSLFTKSGKTNTASSDNSTVIVRPGYENETDGIADATAITSKPSGSITSFQGKAILQPCALITLDDLKNHKLLLAANALTGPVERVGYTGQGTNNVDSDPILLPDEEESNSCRYSIQKEDKPGSVVVSAWQSFELSEDFLQEELADSFAPQPDIGGLKVYKETDSNSIEKDEVTYLIRATSATARLRMSAGDEATRAKLLEKLAERLKAAETSPTQSITFGYESPTMDKAVYTSCDTLNDTNFTQVVGLNAGRLTEEKFASAIGVVQDPKTNKPYNYTSYDCRRTAAGDISGSFTIQTRTYETEAGAAAIFALERTPEGLAQNIQPVSGLGNEAYYGDFATLNKAVGFRQGRVLVFATYANAKTSNQQTPEKRITALHPILEAMAKSLEAF